MSTTLLICPQCGAQLNFGLEITPGMVVDCLVCMTTIEVQPGMAQIVASEAAPPQPITLVPDPPAAATNVSPEPIELPAVSPAVEAPPPAPIESTATPATAPDVPAIPPAESPVLMSTAHAPPPLFTPPSAPATPPTSPAAAPSKWGDRALIGALAVAACIGLFFAVPRFAQIADDSEVESPKPGLEPANRLAQGPALPKEVGETKKGSPGQNLLDELKLNSNNGDSKLPLQLAKKPVEKDELLSVELPKALAESDEELFREALKLAQQSLESGNYDQAVNWFQIAGKLRHNDQVMQGLQLAETRRAEALVQETRRRESAERESRLVRYERWMVKGKASLFLQEFANAIDAFQQALKLFPDDTRAREALAEVELMRRRFQSLQDEEQRRLALLRERRAQQASEDFKRSMRDGYQALNRGSYLQALGLFAEAKRICPWNEEAHDAWDRARRNLDLEQAEARRREDEKIREEIALKKKQEQREQESTFDRLMLEGRKSLDKQQYDLAFIAFAQASRMRPDLAQPLELKEQAERSRNDLARAQELADKARADKLIRETQEAFQRSEKLEREQALVRKKEDAERQLNVMEQLVLDTTIALATHDFGKAIELAGKGRQMQPLDARFGKLLEDAQRGRKQRQESIERDRLLAQELARANDAALRKRLEEKQRAQEIALAKEKEERQRLAIELMLKEGRQAFGVGRFDLALQQFEAVRQLQPGNTESIAWIPRIRKQREVVGQAIALDRKKIADDLILAQAVARRQKQKVEEFEAEQNRIREENRRARDFEHAFVEGKLALGKGNFDVALAQFGTAKQLRKDDPQLDRLVSQAKQGSDEQAERKAKEDRRIALERARQAQQAKQRQADRALIEQDQQSRAQSKKMEQELKSLVKQGQDALARQRLDQAMGAFSQALQLQPNDLTAREGLERARLQRDTALSQTILDEQKKTQEQAALQAKKRQQKNESEAERFVRFGQQALAKKDHAAALLAFDQALQLVPGDLDAKRGLEQARQAREQFVSQQTALSDAARQRHEQRKAAEEAQRKAIADAKENAIRLAQQKQELDAANLTRLLATARAGIELRQFDAANLALEAARKITPDDPAIARLNREMELARADAANAKVREALKLLPLDTRERKSYDEARVDLLVGEGRRHLQAGRRDDAIRDLEAALRIAPGHTEARDLLAQAKRR